MDNAERADLATLAIEAFDTNNILEPKEAVQDLITDLGHYCDRHGLDFHQICARAIAGHAGEKSDKVNNDGWSQPAVIITVDDRLVADIEASPEWEKKDAA